MNHAERSVRAVDALGFKGIWGRLGDEAEERVLTKLETMETTTRGRVDFENGLPQPVEAPGLVGNVHVSFLSDTIAMGCALGTEPPDPRKQTAKGRTIITLVLHLARLLRSAARTDPPLTYRGYVSFGRFAIKGNFILGPAVDEAAGMERLADGAFVWLGPAAKEILEAEGIAEYPGFPESSCLHRVRVP
jgi:hypothetical protein